VAVQALRDYTRLGLLSTAERRQRSRYGEQQPERIALIRPGEGRRRSVLELNAT
jgi:DNA-binding transcriptional MerR regulator